jgi:hypothetical protein
LAIGADKIFRKLSERYRAASSCVTPKGRGLIIAFSLYFKATANRKMIEQIGILTKSKISNKVNYSQLRLLYWLCLSTI